MLFQRHLEETGPQEALPSSFGRDLSGYTLRYVTDWHHDPAFCCESCLARRRAYDVARIVGVFPGLVVKDGIVENIQGPDRFTLLEIHNWLCANLPRLDASRGYSIRLQDGDFETYE